MPFRLQLLHFGMVIHWDHLYNRSDFRNYHLKFLMGKSNHNYLKFLKLSLHFNIIIHVPHIDILHHPSNEIQRTLMGKNMCNQFLFLKVYHRFGSLNSRLLGCKSRGFRNLHRWTLKYINNYRILFIQQHAHGLNKVDH